MEQEISDVTQLLAPNQTVLVSNGGDRFHLPSRTGNGPVCATVCDEKKGWNEKEYSILDDFVDPCSKCASVFEQSPKVVNFSASVCSSRE